MNQAKGEYSIFVGKRRGKVEVTLVNADGSFQTVCDCGTVNLLRQGRALPTKCRECTTYDRSQTNQPHNKTDVVVEKLHIEEEAMIEDYQRSQTA